MKFCIVGAGAIGGLLGAHLARAGFTVTLIARGEHLEKIARNGLTLIQDGNEIVINNITATDNITAAGEHDVVLLAVKAHQIGAVVDALPALFGRDTVLVTLQNGIPWWYFQNLPASYKSVPAQFADRHIEAADPAGKLAAAIDPRRLLGCVAYPAAVIDAPGVIRHIEGDRFPLGELDGALSARAEKVSKAFIKAGFKSPVLTDIRAEIWLKVSGNLAFNPISAMTHATLQAICRFAPTRALAAEMMCEARAVGEKVGAHFRVDIDRRIDGAERVGEHKTSMLQDVESGKPLEIDAVLGAVVELADATETPAPILRAMFACVGLLHHRIENEHIAVKEFSLNPKSS